MNIDLNDFKKRVVTVTEEARSLANIVTDTSVSKQLNDLIVSLNNLDVFVNDELNISVLTNYLGKDTDSNQSPLNEVCKSVLDNLELIYPWLEKSFFDCLRPNANNQGREFISENLHNLRQLVSNNSFINLLSVYNVLKYLDGHNKTLIIVGPNGSGKTSFANIMRNSDNHVKVIPASKPIKALGYIPTIYNTSIEMYNNELYSGGVLEQDMLQKLIIGMCNEHDDIARKFYDTGVKEKKSTYEKVKEIFDEFFEVKLDNSSFSSKNMKAKKDEGMTFDFNSMSDGERVAFFYISTVIAAPDNSFIVVDEPENHLNPAIYNKIWDRLIDKRCDCQFIFISHTIDFISARSNFELVTIKNFTYPDKFEFVFMGNALDNIKSNLWVEILGSRKTILFCEGSKSNYDYKVYESLFGKEYTIIPSGNCLSVIRNVQACNSILTSFNIQNAIGVIDSDLRSEEDKKQLENEKIFTLECNEIEMLLIDESIFKKSLKRVYKQESLFEAFKNDFFDVLEKRKEVIVKRLVKTQIDRIFRNTLIDDRNNTTRDEIKKSLSDIFSQIDVDCLWCDSENIINKIIANKNYEEALKYCCLGHGEIVSGLANKHIPDYVSIALGVLHDDCELSKRIKNKYLSSI